MRGAASVAGVLVLGLMLAGCGDDDKSAAGDNGAPQAVKVGPENTVRVTRGEIVTGPILSGELRAENEATVRAEIGGPMLEVAVREAQPVRKGTLLGRIEASTLQDARRSAASAVESAENQLALARREAERTQELVTAGALAARDLDVARANVSSAEAQLADARARLVSAQNQLDDAVLRAPIDGIVARRAVSVGDVVAPGTELFAIIDPRSMRLEASVPSDQLSALRIGAPVQFEVRGYDAPQKGRVERIGPQADPVTRQVPIFVAIPNAGGRLVAGLFAEGRVISESADGLIVPADAVNERDGAPWVLRVSNGRAEKVNVTIGLRDPRTERVQIASGLDAGDVLLRGSAQGITPGTPIETGAGAASMAER